MLPHIIYIDYYMAFFISYSLSALGHDISPELIDSKDDERYDMKNDML